MRIHGICIAKDEDDFLEEVISSAATWADNIFIVDNASDDSTVYVIEKLTKKFPNVNFVGILKVEFSDTLIANVFNVVKHKSTLGDWWCRLDADEIYIDNPRNFLSTVPSHVDVVWSSHFSFRFTEKELYEYESNPLGFLQQPVSERLHYYLNDGSERRFVKHTFPFIWQGCWPKYRYSAADKKIRLRQYQYRSPEQIVKRLTNRRSLIEQSKGKIFEHEMSESQRMRFKDTSDNTGRGEGFKQTLDFKERVVPTTGLDFYIQNDWVERTSDLTKSSPIKPRFVPLIVWKVFYLFRLFGAKIRNVLTLLLAMFVTAY